MERKTAAEQIIHEAISSAMPGAAVKRALEGRQLPESITLVAIGKAGWAMAKAAHDLLGSRIRRGIVITKYGHALHPLGNLCP